MKILLVLRHAKAVVPNGAPDFDRPLARKGEIQASRMGAALAALETIPDHILTSPAVRTLQTARSVADHADYHGRIEKVREIYEARPDALVSIIRKCPKEAERILLVGHNPGLEGLVSRLVGGREAGGPAVRLSTCALAYLGLDIDRWEDVSTEIGTLGWLLTPEIVDKLSR